MGNATSLQERVQPEVSGYTCLVEAGVNKPPATPRAEVLEHAGSGTAGSSLACSERIEIEE